MPQLDFSFWLSHSFMIFILFFLFYFLFIQVITSKLYFLFRYRKYNLVFNLIKFLFFENNFFRIIIAKNYLFKNIFLSLSWCFNVLNYILLLGSINLKKFLFFFNREFIKFIFVF